MKSRQRPGASKYPSRIESMEPRRLMSTYTVNTPSDAINPGSGLLTLRMAIAAATAHAGADTVAFAPAVFPTGSSHLIKLTQGAIVFSDTTGTTTVAGPGTTILTIDGNQAGRIFYVAAKTKVSIVGITMTGGKSAVADANGNTQGGAIYSAGYLTITSSVVTDSTVTATGVFTSPGGGYGGGVYATGPLTIAGTTFLDNTVSNTSSGMVADNVDNAGGSYGGAISCDGPLVLLNDLVNGNRAVGADSVTYDNSANADGGPAAGGGIYATASVSISGSTIDGNTASGGNGYPSFDGGGGSGGADGGGIYSAGNAIGVSGCTIDGNAAFSGDSGNDPEVQVNSASGGGIYAATGLVLSTTNVRSNTATTTTDDRTGSNLAAGGGICVAGNATISSANISDNTLTGGVPEGDVSAAGGGVYVGGTLTLSETTVSGNVSTVAYANIGGDAGIAVGGGVAASGTITESTLSGNSAIGANGYTAKYNEYEIRPGGFGFGGGAYSDAALTITNSTAANNRASGGTGGSPGESDLQGQGGGDADGAGLFVTALTVRDSTVTGNVATAGAAGTQVPYETPTGPGTAAGGGIHASTLTITNSIASGNTADGGFNDLVATTVSGSGGDLIGVGGGLNNGVNGNHIGDNDPELFPLGNNGGPTLTMVPRYGSPVIDAGVKSLVPAGVSTDQRGAGRVLNGTVDIGAAEVNLFNVPVAGKVLGTAGSYRNHGTVAANAVDGNVATYFDGPDASGDFVGLDLGTAKTIDEVSFVPRSGYDNRMLGGIFQASNSATFATATTLYTVPTTPDDGVITSIPLPNSAPFRYVRYAGPANSFCDVAEIRFFTPAAATELRGAVIGTPGSYRNHGTVIADAVDGNLTTFFDGPDATGDWVGFDLRSARAATMVTFAPRAQYPGRMLGGMFQASNSPTFSTGVVTLATITTQPPAGMLSTLSLSNAPAYRYYRYLGPANGYCDIADLAIFG